MPKIYAALYGSDEDEFASFSGSNFEPIRKNRKNEDYEARPDKKRTKPNNDFNLQRNMKRYTETDQY